MRHRYSRDRVAAGYVYGAVWLDWLCPARKSTRAVTFHLDDAYCPTSLFSRWCGTWQLPVFVGNKCIVSIRCDGHIKSTGCAIRATMQFRIGYCGTWMTLAVHATWFGQTSQTKKFSALPLNRGANADLRRTRKKLHPVNMSHGFQTVRRWEINNLLAAARVNAEIRCAENLNTRGESGRWRSGLPGARCGFPCYRYKYISIIIRNQRIVGGSESRIELCTRCHLERRRMR